MADDTFRDFPVFATALNPEQFVVGPYLGLLLLELRASEAVSIVSTCLEGPDNKRKRVGSLVVGNRTGGLRS